MEKRFIWAVIKEIMVEYDSDGYHDFFDELDTNIVLFDSEEKAIKSKDEELKKILQLCLEHNIFNEDIIEAVEKYLGITEVENYDEDEDYMIDEYENKYNIDLSDAIFVVLYEVFDFNEIGDYVAEIYPLI